MSQKLRGAVVGVGYLGTFHAQKYKALNEDIELVGVCDAYEPQAKKVAADLGVKAFTKYQDLVGHVDMVTIASSTAAHFEIAQFFLSQGIHVNVEKPITAKSKEAEELMAIAAKKNLILTVGHVERFNPGFQELKKHIKKPLHIEMMRLASFKPRGADVSVVHDLMIHDIDLMFAMAGNTEIESVSATGTTLITETLDAVSADFKFKNGVTAHIQSSRLGVELKREIRVIEADCILTCNLSTGVVEKISKDTSSTTLAQKIETFQAEKADGLMIETQKYIQAVKGGSIAITAQEAYLALLTVEKVVQKINGK